MTPERVDEIRRYLLDVSRELDAFIASKPTAEEACAALYGMNMVKRDISVVYDSFADQVSDLMGNNNNIDLPNGGKIEKKSSYDRRAWQHKELASAVAGKLVQMSVDMDTGEIIKTPEEIALQVLDYVQPSYWRVKELSNLGINADNYCETGVLKTSIIVRKGDSE